MLYVIQCPSSYIQFHINHKTGIMEWMLGIQSGRLTFLTLTRKQLEMIWCVLNTVATDALCQSVMTSVPTVLTKYSLYLTAVGQKCYIYCGQHKINYILKAKTPSCLRNNSIHAELVSGNRNIFQFALTS